MGNGQTTYDNKTLDHNLYSNWFRNPKCNLCSNQPQTAKTWQMTAKFCSCFQLRTNQESCICFKNQSHRIPFQYLFSLPPTFPCQKPPIKAYLKFFFFFFHHKLFLLPCLSLSFLNTGNGSWLASCSKLQIASLLIWVVFIYFHILQIFFSYLES